MSFAALKKSNNIQSAKTGVSIHSHKRNGLCASYPSSEGSVAPQILCMKRSCIYSLLLRPETLKRLRSLFLKEKRAILLSLHLRRDFLIVSGNHRLIENRVLYTDTRLSQIICDIKFVLRYKFYDYLDTLSREDLLNKHLTVLPFRIDIWRRSSSYVSSLKKKGIILSQYMYRYYTDLIGSGFLHEELRTHLSIKALVTLPYSSEEDISSETNDSMSESFKSISKATTFNKRCVRDYPIYGMYELDYPDTDNSNCPWLLPYHYSISLPEGDESNGNLGIESFNPKSSFPDYHNPDFPFVSSQSGGTVLPPREESYVCIFCTSSKYSNKNNKYLKIPKIPFKGVLKEERPPINNRLYKEPFLDFLEITKFRDYSCYGQVTLPTYQVITAAPVILHLEKDKEYTGPIHEFRNNEYKINFELMKNQLQHALISLDSKVDDSSDAITNYPSEIIPLSSEDSKQPDLHNEFWWLEDQKIVDNKFFVELMSLDVPNPIDMFVWDPFKGGFPRPYPFVPCPFKEDPKTGNQVIHTMDKITGRVLLKSLTKDLVMTMMVRYKAIHFDKDVFDLCDIPGIKHLVVYLLREGGEQLDKFIYFPLHKEKNVSE